MKHIQSAKNQQVKLWKKLHQKKYRDETNMFLIEGKHLVEEAIKGEQAFEAILVQDDEVMPPMLQNMNSELYIVSRDVMQAICDTKTPQGIAAICKITNGTEIKNDNYSKLLLVDGVQDPGNLGTLIRTADAVGLDGIIISEGSADIYNSKVVRSTQGSLFHIPVIKGDLIEWIERLEKNSVSVFGSALEGAVPYGEISAQERFALVVGNEGSGVRKELLDRTSQNLYVPIYGQAESLNVAIASGILLYHLRA
ncbi:TrmH family RNA methyltransferase [Bacillus solimangrovi]|uniref:RNA methyltransferase n=1 Tax=Bacillus solimangrovi TaxID=1305675 RepID=A0A1E5LCT7_9BACI|nr:RNA methyltransferase [Bacillus solimangrovi]OEH91883.1 RNA methyltransferase [Bacillus solimangrovi]